MTSIKLLLYAIYLAIFNIYSNEAYATTTTPVTIFINISLILFLFAIIFDIFDYLNKKSNKKD